MWEGEWARVVVTEVSGDEVGVFFMDYGNTGVVKIKDLRPLTVDIIKLPAQVRESLMPQSAVFALLVIIRLCKKEVWYSLTRLQHNKRVGHVKNEI